MIWIKRNIRFWSETFFFSQASVATKKMTLCGSQTHLAPRTLSKKEKKKRGIDFYYVFSNRLGENSEDDF